MECGSLSEQSCWTLKVAQLQTQLEDEKALRQGLERALGGADTVSPPQVALTNLAPQVRSQQPPLNLNADKFRRCGML